MRSVYSIEKLNIKTSIMKKFIVTYHAPIDAMQQTAESSKEDMEKGMEAWMLWAQKCGEQLVDFGTPLGNGQKLIPGGNSESSERQVVGYSILQSDSLEEAEGLLKDHPHLAWDAACEIEVHESLAVPGS